MEKNSFRLFLLNAGALAVTIGLFHVVGAYVAIPLFMVFYLRFLGNHSWLLTTSLATVVPIGTFLFFEVALQKTLPKGYTEPFFEPIYAVIY